MTWPIEEPECLCKFNWPCALHEEDELLDVPWEAVSVTGFIIAEDTINTKEAS
jgi:hypothetical protein